MIQKNSAQRDSTVLRGQFLILLLVISLLAYVVLAFDGDSTPSNSALISPILKQNISGSFLLNVSARYLSGTGHNATNASVYFWNASSNLLVTVLNITDAGRDVNLTLNGTFNSVSLLPDGVYNLTINITNASDGAQIVNKSVFKSSGEFIVVDNTPPQFLEFFSPLDRTNLTTGDIATFNVSVSNASGTALHAGIFELKNYSGFMSKNFTGMATNNTLFNFSQAVANLNDGNYTLYIFSNDTAGNINRTFNTAQSVTFVVDTTAPASMELYNLTERLNLSKNVPTFSFQGNDSWSSGLNCELSINSIMNTTGISAGNGSTTNQVAVRSLPDGHYNWSVRCNDSVRLGTTSVLRNFTIDTVVPGVIGFDAPLSRQNFTTGETIVFNSSISNLSGTATHVVIFELSNGTLRNFTASGTNETSFNASVAVSGIQDGNHTLYVFANDTAGNINRTFNTAQSVTFVVDTTAPNVPQLYNLTNRFNTSKTIPTFSFQVNDTWTPTMSCSLLINSQTNTTGISAANGTTINQAAVRSLPEGNYNWTISCNDSVRLNTVSIMNNFTISTTGARVNITNSSHSTTDTTPALTVNYTHLVGMTSADCTLYNQTDNVRFGTTTVANDTNTVLTVNNTLGDGVYALFANCTDPAGVVTQSLGINVTVDTTAPTTSASSTGIGSLSVTTNEDATCKYSTSDFDYDTMSGIMVGMGATHTKSELSEDFTYYVRCRDTLGNTQLTSKALVTASSSTTSTGGSGGGGGRSASTPESEPAVEAEAESTEVPRGDAGSEGAEAAGGSEGAAEQGAAEQAGARGGEAGAEGRALAGKATGEFTQVLKSLTWLWVTIVVVAVSAGAAVYLSKRHVSKRRKF